MQTARLVQTNVVHTLLTDTRKGAYLGTYDGLFITDFAIDSPGMHQRALGAYHLARVLEKKGVSSIVIDFFFSLRIDEIDCFFQKFISKNTKFIGLSTSYLFNRVSSTGYDTTFDDNTSLNYFFEKVRTCYPHIKIFQGGSNGLYPHPLVDVGMSGQYIESAFIKKLNELCNCKIDTHYEFTNDFFEFKKEDFILDKEPLPLEISRGCIFSCKFCSFSGRGKKINTAIKSNAAIENFLKTSYDRFKTTSFFLCDDTLNESVIKLENILRVTELLNFKCTFAAYIRLDLLMVYPEMIGLLKNAGILGLTFGIETFNFKAGVTIGKGSKPEKIKSFLIDLKMKHPEFYTSSAFIVGLPYENIDSVYSTYDWLVKEQALDAWNFNALGIENRIQTVDSSYFSKNIEKYGYKRKGNVGWARDDLNYEQAFEHAKYLNQLSAPYSGPSPWRLLGLTRKNRFEDIKNIKIPDLAKYADFEKPNLYKKLIFES